MIELLILNLSNLTDTLGVPLIKPEMYDIWLAQKSHIHCLQGVPGVLLYTVTHYIKKHGVSLPVYRCARGSTSLESFHLHLNRFIPGSSASPYHFQTYLLDGVARWNAVRAKEALDTLQTNIGTFNIYPPAHGQGEE